MQNKKKEETDRRHVLKSLCDGRLFPVLIVLAGNFVYALAVAVFLIPAGLMTGGTTGIALAVNRLTGIPVAGFVFLFNVIMLIIGWLVLGKQFALTTILSTFAYPVALQLVESVIGDRALTNDILLCTLFAGMGIGASLGLVIRAGASTGGMDIPPLILNRYFGVPVSVSLYVFDICILLLQIPGNTARNVLYGILLVIVYTVVLDKFLLMGTTRTEVKVISSRNEEIREAILQEIDRGVTMLSARSGYLDEETQMIFSVISNRELPRIERLIHQIDPDSFMVVSRVSEVSGRGFSRKKEYRSRK